MRPSWKDFTTNLARDFGPQRRIIEGAILLGACFYHTPHGTLKCPTVTVHNDSLKPMLILIIIMRINEKFIAEH